MLKKISLVPVIYLAGGMKGTWQDRIMAAIPDAIFIDPRNQPTKSPEDYTAWDLAAVERCDVVFGFMEATNPGGSGLAVEFGWGARAGKHLVFVEEQGYPQHRYFGMVRSLADCVVSNPDMPQDELLDEGIAHVLAWMAGSSLKQ